MDNPRTGEYVPHMETASGESINTERDALIRELAHLSSGEWQEWWGGRAQRAMRTAYLAMLRERDTAPLVGRIDAALGYIDMTVESGAVGTYRWRNAEVMTMLREVRAILDPAHAAPERADNG